MQDDIPTKHDAIQSRLYEIRSDISALKFGLLVLFITGIIALIHFW